MCLVSGRGQEFHFVRNWEAVSELTPRIKWTISVFTTIQFLSPVPDLHVWQGHQPSSQCEKVQGAEKKGALAGTSTRTTWSGARMVPKDWPDTELFDDGGSWRVEGTEVTWPCKDRSQWTPHWPQSSAARRPPELRSRGCSGITSRPISCRIHSMEDALCRMQRWPLSSESKERKWMASWWWGLSRTTSWQGLLSQLINNNNNHHHHHQQKNHQ